MSTIEPRIKPDPQYEEWLRKTYGVPPEEPLKPQGHAEDEELIELVCDGKSNDEIAEILDVTVAVVKNRLYDIFQKRGVKNRQQLIVQELGNG